MKLKSIFTLIIFPIAFSAFAQPWLQSIPQSSNAYRTEPAPDFYDLKNAFVEYWKNKSIHENENENAAYGGHQQFARYAYLMESRTYPDGKKFDPSILYREYKKEKEKFAHHKLSAAGNWSYIGHPSIPNAGGGTGRINIMRIDPTDPNKLYAGAACGGLWMSSDGGVNWSTTSDLLPSISIGDIAINPIQPNILYVATGDAFGYEVGGDFWGGVYTAGIFKSIDGGLTWTALSFGGFDQINKQVIQRLIINPSNPDVLLASSRSYIYRSNDAGQSWIRVLSGHFYDLEFKPGNPSIVYAASGDRIYKSVDGGLTFPFNTLLAGSSGRMSIDVTAANSNVIYALSENGPFYKSLDEGVTFVNKTQPSGTTTFYGYYDNVLAVSPVDENVVICGGLDMVRSNNGGTSWTVNSSAIHVDQKHLEFIPGSSNSYYACNDGSIYKTTNGGVSWVDLGAKIYIKQYYRMSSSKTNPSIYYAGAQDNGSDQNNGIVWRKVYGGDGMDCAVHPTNSNIAFVSSQYGNFRRTNNNGGNFTGVAPSGQSGAWVTPIAINESNPNWVYIGYQDLYLSTDGGNSFSSLTTNVFSGADFQRIEIAPSDPNVIYAASNNSIKRSDDAGFTFVNVSVGLPISSVALTDIEVSSDNPAHVWVTLTGYNSGMKIYKSTDAGATWTNISKSLPNLPATCLAYQPGSNDMIYVGTDIGVYYKDNNMADWLPYNDGLPNVMISELEILPAISKIRTATYGRGIWESDLATSTFNSVDAGVVSFTNLPKQSCDGNIAPEVLIQNFGSNDLISATIQYRIQGGAIQSFAWNGLLSTLSSTAVALPNINQSSGQYSIEAWVTAPNGLTDQNAANDSSSSHFTVNTNSIVPTISEDFETVFPSANYTVSGSDNFISQSNAAGGFGLSSQCLKIGFYDNANGKAELLFEPIDLSLSNPSIQLSFDVAYKRILPTIRDSFVVEVSQDCGATWNVLYAKYGAALSTASGYGYSPFTPMANEWRNDVISLGTYAGQPKVLIRMKFISNYGHFLYFDNINISQTSGQDDLQLSKIAVYPNPAQDYLILKNFDAQSDNTDYTIYDLSGRVVADGKLNSNDNAIDIRQLPQGSYLLFLETNGETFKTPFVKTEL
ncbi:MAG TPA: T9SS type A sorting domain-containing protein [Bacteroidia bacterium]|nr:T9SS type A sorting domain-containing protein [Bacteroidia bacterium]HNT80580.1 T9SS type A sorting domain-containing protein [Bacteroidia bacterium]